MEIAFYKDYVVDLKKQIDDLRQNPDAFQVYDLQMEILLRKVQISYALSRHKGQNDSLFYMNDTVNGKRSQLKEDAALGVFEHFFALGQFLAVAGEATDLSEGEFTNLLTVDWTYPVCAVGFSCRRKGQPAARSMKMLFIGLNNDEDATTYVRTIGQAGFIVGHRPLATRQLWEWK
ncbi:hypothetical protein [Rhizobium tubonense]|uniref:Uncharacterized protein n=1 Tax=Rhizobium tubonense TaxID=484088 RepID=A0A2W4EPR8_9HYPH|nr:hypothetical protein [Rhizobium tubonense]PZM15516.1 hypothetical protein CPY51_06715 [Rhizobium tubonense]